MSGIVGFLQVLIIIFRENNDTPWDFRGTSLAVTAQPPWQATGEVLPRAGRKGRPMDFHRTMFTGYHWLQFTQDSQFNLLKLHY